MDNASTTRYQVEPAWQYAASAPAGMTLFCFPHSGASASVYSAWVNNIPNVSVRPVEYPGHGTRLAEPLFTALPPLIEAVAQAILPSLRPPYALFGHSMGALVAFELARTLHRRGIPAPAHLFVSGHGAPHLADPHPPIYHLPTQDFIQKIREMNGTEAAFFENRELQEVFLPILRADFTICETYTCQPYLPLDCPVTALGGLRDPDVSRADLEAWQAHTSQPVKVRMFPGDHFYLKNNGRSLLEILARELNQPGTRPYPATGV